MPAELFHRAGFRLIEAKKKRGARRRFVASEVDANPSEQWSRLDLVIGLERV